MNNEEKIQLRAFAMMDGLYLGIMWTVSFGLYVIGLAGSFLGTFSLFTAVYSLFFAAKRMRLFRDNVRQAYMPYGMTFLYMLLMFGTGCMVCAIMQYLYFALLDNGFMVDKYTEAMSTAEAKTAMAQYGLNPKDVDDALAMLSTVDPLSLTLSILNINIIISLIACTVISLFTYGNNKPQQNGMTQ